MPNPSSNEQGPIGGDVTIDLTGPERTSRLSAGVTVNGEFAGLIRQAAGSPTDVRLQRTRTEPTEDQPLWVAIRNRTQAIGFSRYSNFIQSVLCEGADASTPNAADDGSTPASYGSPSLSQRRTNLAGRPTIQGVDAYRLLKLATEAFMLFECGVVIEPHEGFDADAESRRLGSRVDLGALQSELRTYLGGSANEPGTLRYLDRIAEKLVRFQTPAQAEASPFCQGVLLSHRLTNPCLIELIWSYWHEEGMLVQTMNSIAFRFQNRSRGPRDPLANLELDPLRPLNNLIWGFIQDESDRLSVQRRAYEYDHHYGITLIGKAVRDFLPADSRRRFIEAFHNLLNRAMLFYREDDDTTIIADAFSLLNALREVHIVLAEGAHNQFGDLPWKARKEMLMMQWMLARPEIREFIRGRYMVPYQELWMGAVDDMKRLQGWSDIGITHFHELAIYGEQILLSVRYGDWIDINDQELARNWARYWRPEIQRYIHAYNAVTGVDLAVEISDVRLASNRFSQPAQLIADRMGRRRGSLPADSRAALPGPDSADSELLVGHRMRSPR